MTDEFLPVFFIKAVLELLWGAGNDGFTTYSPIRLL